MNTRARNALLRRVLAAGRAKKLGATRFKLPDGKMCAIGFLMPETVLKEVHARGLNDVGVELLFEREGLGRVTREQLRAATAPLTVPELRQLQVVHDETLGAPGPEKHAVRMKRFEAEMKRVFKVTG